MKSENKWNSILNIYSKTQYLIYSGTHKALELEDDFKQYNVCLIVIKQIRIKLIK